MGKKILPPKGFTLIELLVVVAIIAILSVVGVVVFQGQVRNARNSARRSGVEAVVQAMEANKVAGATAYTALAASFFASGTIPVDPTATNVAPDSACPGVCKFCVKAATGTCSIADTLVDVGAPGAVTSFQICTNLEGGGSYCKGSSQ